VSSRSTKIFEIEIRLKQKLAEAIKSEISKIRDFWNLLVNSEMIKMKIDIIELEKEYDKKMLEEVQKMDFDEIGLEEGADILFESFGKEYYAQSFDMRDYRYSRLLCFANMAGYLNKIGQIEKSKDAYKILAFKLLGHDMKIGCIDSHEQYIKMAEYYLMCGGLDIQEFYKELIHSLEVQKKDLEYDRIDRLRISKQKVGDPEGDDIYVNLLHLDKLRENGLYIKYDSLNDLSRSVNAIEFFKEKGYDNFVAKMKDRLKPMEKAIEDYCDRMKAL
jgi:hypothetical protein